MSERCGKPPHPAGIIPAFRSDRVIDVDDGEIRPTGVGEGMQEAEQRHGIGPARNGHTQSLQ